MSSIVPITPSKRRVESKSWLSAIKILEEMLLPNPVPVTSIVKLFPAGVTVVRILDDYEIPDIIELAIGVNSH